MKLRQILIAAIIMLFGLVLRLHNYAVYPQRGATSDEYSYSFQGVSLFTVGVPISWSAMSAYKNRYDLTIEHIYFPMVWPYFDHTPLNGIVVGGWAVLFGENTFEKITLPTIRIVPIALSVLSSVFVWLLAFRLYGAYVASWSLLLYSIVTTFVMNGRVVLAENLLTPFMLAAVYGFSVWQKKLTEGKVLVLGLLSGLALWTKELGISVWLTLTALFVHDRVQLRFVRLLVFCGIFAVSSYLLYGAYFGWETLFDILGLQSKRPIGPRTLLYIITTPVIVNKVYIDGWYLLGFVALAVSFLDFSKNKFIIVPSLTYILLLISSLNQEGEMGWYIIPLFPFLAISTARLIQLSLTTKRWLVFLVLSFIGQYLIQYGFEESFGLVTHQYRVLLALLYGPFIVAFIFRREKLIHRLTCGYYALFVLLTAYETYTYIHPA